MPPIPIYRSSPITAAKPSGITPKTARPEDREKSTGVPQSVDTPTSTYPAAQPEARPSLPAPTRAPQLAQPTPTRTAAESSPPAPQPGAVPIPPSGGHPPPPPKAGDSLRNAQTQATEVPVPPQMFYAPTGGSDFAARRSSTTTAVPGPSGMAMAGLGTTPMLGGNTGTKFSHPPGYHQDVHASEFSSAQRAAHEAAVAQDNGRRLSLMGDDDGEGVWQAAKKWASAAGEGLAAAENEVWKRINKD
ncbi:hypothetical protein ACJ41O_003986 [Fusarium nematophilum]